MKQNFTIQLTVNGIGDKIQLQSQTSLSIANEAFKSLQLFARGSLLIGSVALYVKAKDTFLKLDEAKV